MYDQDENFSIISKITEKLKTGKNLKIYNKGEGIRDFINTLDVAKIYLQLIKSKILGIIDIGTGKGIKIIDVINALKVKKYISLKNKNKLKISVANTKKIQKILNKIKIKSLENFFNNKGYKIDRINRLIVPYQKSYYDRQNSIAIFGCGYSGKKVYDQIANKNFRVSTYFIDEDKKKLVNFIKRHQLLVYQILKIFLNI